MRNNFIRAALFAAACVFASPAASRAQTPERPNGQDMSTTITLQLNNVNIDQLVKFLSDTTGKSVLKHREVQTQVTVTSPVPVTKRDALQLIYEALQMDKIYVIELDEMIQIVPESAIKTLPVREIPPETNLEELPDSLGMAQRIYQLKNVTAESIRPHLERFVPETSMTLDTKTNTIILTDQLTRLKRYDRIIQTLDTLDMTDRVIEIFKLKHADAIELSTLIGNILTEAAQQQGMDPRQLAMMRQVDYRSSRYNSRDRGTSMPIVAGTATIVPDPRMNWLIISCPASQLAEIRRLVDEFDQPESIDVKARFLPVRHADANSVAGVVQNLFRETSGTVAKDVIRAIPSDDGASLVIMSSESNFEVIRELVEKLDNEGAEKRETRTYNIKHVEVQDLANQLQNLFDQTSNRSSPFGMSYMFYSSPFQELPTKPTFVASPRTNSLMALAKPKDFAFIEQMIGELDTPIDPADFEPRVYHIRHTDANELVNVLETLFSGGAASARSANDMFWRPVGNTQQTDALKATFGEIRFVVDNVTNTIVALASNRRNYEILDAMVAKLDQVDPESTEVMVYELKYADALDVADHLNNLFSDGAVQRGGQQNQQNQNNNDQDQNNANSAAQVAAAVREIVYPWQATQRDTGRTQEESRPINTMIGNVRVVPDVRSNKVLLAAPPIFFPALRKVIENLDEEEPQVRIKTQFVEVTRGRQRRVGIRWTPDPNSIDPSELENAFLGLGQLGLVDVLGEGQPFGVDSTRAFGGIVRDADTITDDGNTLLSADLNLALLIQLLERNDLGRVISEPALTVHNNELGSLFVGSEVPFRTDTQVTDTGGVTFGTEYRDVGIKLDVTPHINLQGEVVLLAELENSAVRPGEFIDGQVVTDKTTLRTEMSVDSNQTMVIGGVLVDNSSDIDRRVPILGRIPIIKYLFRKSDRERSTRELVVFITPEVLKTRQDDDRLLREAEERLQRLQGDQLPHIDMNDSL